MPVIVSGPEIPVLVNTRVLTKVQFFDLFTSDELTAIYTTAKTVVAVEILLDKFRLAEEVSLDDPATATGLDGLVTAGVLTTERKDAILNLPPDLPM